MNLPKFKNTFHIKRNGSWFGFGTSPAADWKIIVSSFFAMVIAVFVFGSYMYININNGEIFNSEKEIQTGARNLNRDLLREVIGHREVETARLAEIQDSTEVVVDPSF